MSDLFNFLDVIKDDVVALLEVVPDYISTTFSIGCIMMVVLAVKRAVL